MKVTRKIFMLVAVFLVTFMEASAQTRADVEKQLKVLVPIRQTNPLALRAMALGNRDSIFRDGVSGSGECFNNIKMKGQIRFDKKYRVEWVKYIVLSYQYNTGEDLTLTNLISAATSARWETVYVHDHEIITNGRSPATGKMLFSWLPTGYYLFLVYTDPNTGKRIPLIKDVCFNHLFIMKKELWAGSKPIIKGQDRVQDSLAMIDLIKRKSLPPVKTDSVSGIDTTKQKPVLPPKPQPQPQPKPKPAPAPDTSKKSGGIYQQLLQPKIYDADGNVIEYDYKLETRAPGWFIPASPNPSANVDCWYPVKDWGGRESYIPCGGWWDFNYYPNYYWFNNSWWPIQWYYR